MNLAKPKRTFLYALLLLALNASGDLSFTWESAQASTNTFPDTSTGVLSFQFIGARVNAG